MQVCTIIVVRVCLSVSLSFHSGLAKILIALEPYCYNLNKVCIMKHENMVQQHIFNDDDLPCSSPESGCQLKNAQNSQTRLYI